MFDAKTYVERRKALKTRIGSGIVLFLGNKESPMNYTANTYPFRQDSSFLYYWGLDSPGLAATIDVDADEEVIYGYDYTIDDIIWMGPQPTLAEKAARIGGKKTLDIEKFDTAIKEALQKGRVIHFLPQYRADNILKIEKLTGMPTSAINTAASEGLTRAVVAQRAIKADEEVREIEKALAISYEMNTLAMRMSKPGIYEREVSGAIEGLLLALGSTVAFPTIFSVDGQTLHNHSHDNIMQDGDMLVLDSGAESLLHYASDITRTFPVGGKFTSVQKDIYNVVLSAQLAAIDNIKPGVPYRDVHMAAAKTTAEGMKSLGFMKGNVEDAVVAGAHAFFFPHGIGHMLGLDVHDMENLGENFVGYDETVQRSDQFGLAYLRLARKLEPGFVVTVEPGVYFIPELIDQWKQTKKYTDFIDYGQVEKHKDFGGIRIEDDVLVTAGGHRVLGKPIPKSVREVEAVASSST